jgi:predicted dehydrogenase
VPPQKQALGRRKFLKKVVTAAAVAGFPTIIPGSALGMNDATAPSERIHIGSIGVGNMGGGHLRNLLQYEEVRVVGICDVKEERRQFAKSAVDTRYGDKSCVAHKDFRELLARKDVDAVLIATGERWHPLIDIEAARRGKHMYSEKPFALSIAEARASRDAVLRSGVVYQFGTQQRSSNYYRFAKEMVMNGRIGDLQKILICSNGGYGYAKSRIEEQIKDAPPDIDYDTWLGPSPYHAYSDRRVTNIWMSITDYGLGHMGGLWGIHDLDTAQWVNEADGTTPISAEGAGLFHSDIRDTAFIYDIEYKYANGVICEYMDMSTAKQKYEQFRQGAMAVCLVGSKGWIYVAREGMWTNPPELMRSFIGPNERHVIKSNDHKQNFFNAIRTGDRTIATVENAAHDEMMCQMGDIAMRLKRKVRFDPVKEAFIDDPEANRRAFRSMRSPWRIDVPEVSS